MPRFGVPLLRLGIFAVVSLHNTTTDATFVMYDPLPVTSVSYNVSDPLLNALLHHGEALEAANAHVFLAPKPPLAEPFRVIVEGAEYRAAWLETQPMAGGMYASRDVRLALDNQLVFIRGQRAADGRFPHRVDCPRDPGPSLQPAWKAGGYIQGLYMAAPAVDVAWFMNLTAGNQAVAYLRELSSALEAYDTYLWATRNDSSCAGLRSAAVDPTSCPQSPSSNSSGNNRGMLWSIGSGFGYGRHGDAGDTGEDGTDKYINNTGPIQSMDMMGYSYNMRASLARIATLLGDGESAKRWDAAAGHVAALTAANLWREEQGAMYDRDVTDAWVTTLVHNNLRMMWHGLFTQAMADTFVSRHLMNTSEFWTKMPIPSIAISDPRFQDASGNNWSGPPQGLTLQRAIRALESYGHLAELTLLGRELTAALLRGCGVGATGVNNTCHYPQQIDPFTGVPQTNPPDDGYGPMILAMLETTALRAGVVPRAGLGLFWSGIADGGVTTTFEQRLDRNVHRLELLATAFSGWTNGELKFNCTPGVRVVTDLEGRVTGLWGINDKPVDVRLELPAVSGPRRSRPPLSLTVQPNEQWDLTGVQPKLVRRIPFTAPHN